jgi:polyisoprenoid-binding protein YceI
MHKTTTSIFKAIAAATLLTGAMSAQAAWELDGAASSFYYVTSKASAVSEVNSFTSLSGAISDAGAASLAINLASVDTGIDIRNERMRDIVFQVAQHAQATVNVTVDTAALNGLDQDMSAELKVVKLAAGSLQVSTVRPLLVGAASFGLAEEVEQLREIASLPSINPNIVVNFTLIYNQ